MIIRRKVRALISPPRRSPKDTWALQIKAPALITRVSITVVRKIWLSLNIYFGSESLGSVLRINLIPAQRAEKQPSNTKIKVNTAPVPSQRSKYTPRMVKKKTTITMVRPSWVRRVRYLRVSFIFTSFLDRVHFTPCSTPGFDFLLAEGCFVLEVRVLY
jgi:hypothetical protein